MIVKRVSAPRFSLCVTKNNSGVVVVLPAFTLHKNTKNILNICWSQTADSFEFKTLFVISSLDVFVDFYYLFEARCIFFNIYIFLSFLDRIISKI